MGIKYTSVSDDTVGDGVRSVEGAGHLRVHIVEGAGIVDGDTHKPFNTICKW